MIQEKPIAAKTLKKTRYHLAEYRYKYLQTLVLYDYNIMEKRFLQSSTFVLMSGIMLQSAVPGDATQKLIDRDPFVLALGATVMCGVIGATVYFLYIMVTEITKYVLLFQDVRRYASGSDDDLGGKGAANSGMERSKEGLMHKLEMWLKRKLLKEMYFGDGTAKKMSGAMSPKLTLAMSPKLSRHASAESLASTANPMHIPSPKARESVSSNIGLGDVFASPKSDSFSSGDNPFYGSARNVLAQATSPKEGAVTNPSAPSPQAASRLRSRSRSFGSMDAFVGNLLSSTSMPSPTSNAANRASMRPSVTANEMNSLFASAPPKEEQDAHF
jgi:hypothetical protein